MSRRSPKILDVARVAGVSAATVSRALSNPDLVAEETRKSVLDAVATTGYRINRTARNLRRQVTGAIVVLVPNLGNPFFSQILSGIEAVGTAGGYSVLIVDTEQAEEKSDLVREYLHNNRADGVLVLDASLPIPQELRGAGSAPAPLIFACEKPLRSEFPSVTVDNELGARLAIRHLFALGHRAVGHVAGPAGNVLTAARRGAAQAEIAALGGPIRKPWFLSGDFGIESGVRAAQALLAMRERPTAMFCASDLMAFGLISELYAHGVRVPEDLSVVGFDDIEFASRSIPALTTIRQPRVEVGAIAAEMLIGRIAGAAHPHGDADRVLPVELIVRKSTAAPTALA
jgi:LacI family repressor for deo operon, udp, cdd, tsx, nupC, and nupG